MATDLAAVAKRLPPELRVRTAEDADLERIVEFQDRWATPAQWISPAAARAMRSVSPDPSRVDLIVEDARGQIQAVGTVSSGGPFAPPDGSWRGNVRVAPEWRRRGIARSLLERMEEHVRSQGASRLVGSVRGDEPAGASFAEQSGYRAFHERIDAYIEVGSFDASKFDDPDAIARRAGVRIATYAELLRDHGENVEGFQREMLPALWEMARDVPSPTPMPERPPPFEQARRMFFEGPGIDPPTTVIALRDGHPVGITATMVKENGAAYTNFTGVARAERGKGIALALKLRALRELKARGVKLFGTTNDEQNAAMRGVNRKLGYRPEPPTTMYEKRFA
ncbi:MAG TPA: GNAT family N-acetyltransferase [Candidatus Limnocylindria bacterium]|nr:GNAT family N-acetyltransferase [Candidatus Limnocylindria bacterium]